MYLFFIFIIPLAMLLAVLSTNNIRSLARLHACGYLVVLGCVSFLAYTLKRPFEFLNFFYIDALSAFFLFVIALVTSASALFSIAYIMKDYTAGVFSQKKARMYYLLFDLFSLSMFFVPVVNNLGMVWVGIELTTLASAFLVGFYNNKASLEAAWKYLIICSVGIIFALFGTIIFYYTASHHAGLNSLNWTDMAASAKHFNSNIVKIAFLFILVGYGTKAGLAPMHTWLPDAHSQAISPVSAMLSGVLLKTALYAILRFSVIVNICIGSQYSSRLFMLFGLISLGVACFFLLVQKHIKRFFAYSSIEHVGIISVGFGIGGSLGLYGALLHIFNHATTKSLLFFSAANVVKKYKKDTMHSIKGVINALPFTGSMLIAGMFAIAGMPPFSIFFSELLILIAGFGKGAYVVSGMLLACITIIFGAIIFHVSRILFGKKPHDMPVEQEPVTSKAAFLMLVICMCAVGFKVPVLLHNLIAQAAVVIAGR